jgi:hypothetical protein
MDARQLKTKRFGQTGVFFSLPAVPCDGRAAKAVVELPPELPRPLGIVSAYYQLHTGTHPILEIAGLFNLFIGRRPLPVVLVGGMNRHGAVRWVHDPPVWLQEGEQIEASYGGAIPRNRAERIAMRLGVLRRREPFAPWILPDIQITWIASRSEAR